MMNPEDLENMVFELEDDLEQTKKALITLSEYVYQIIGQHGFEAIRDIIGEVSVNEN